MNRSFTGGRILLSKQRFWRPSKAREVAKERPTLLFCTLLPAYFGRRNEDRNILALVREYLASYAPRYRLTLLLGSAHSLPLELAKELLNGFSGIEVQTVLLPFKPRPELDELRAHEVAFCKQELARLIRGCRYDFLIHFDADLYVPFDDLHSLIGCLSQPMSFVNIPYVLHEKLSAPPQQLGAYIHGKHLLDKIDYTASIYGTVTRDGRVCPLDSPDCAVRTHLLRRGACELRAEPPAFCITSRHYSDDGSYGLYQAGEMTRHSADAVARFPGSVNSHHLDGEF